MFPYPQRKLAMKIHAGDSVTVQVSYNPARKDFRLSLTDHTRGEHVTRLRQCPKVKVSGKRVTCPRSSAEVIAEAPATESGQDLVISPLSDYGAISFADISVTDGAGSTAASSRRTGQPPRSFRSAPRPGRSWRDRPRCRLTCSIRTGWARASSRARAAPAAAAGQATRLSCAETCDWSGCPTAAMS